MPNEIAQMFENWKSKTIDEMEAVFVDGSIEFVRQSLSRETFENLTEEELQHICNKLYFIYTYQT